MLLYNGESPPDSVLVYSRSHINSDVNEKITKKSQPRRCKSSMEGKTMPSESPDNPANVSASGEGSRNSKSGHRLATSTTTTTLPLHQNSLSAKGISDTGSDNSTHTIRIRNKNPPPPRVELKMSKCSLYDDLKAADELRRSTARLKVIASSSALTEWVPISISGSPEATAPVCVDEQGGGRAHGEKEPSP